MAALAAAPAADVSADVLTRYVYSLAAVGLALLFVEPGSKHPVDMRGAVQRRRDDEDAQDEAKAAGRADWTRAKAKAGVHLATADAEVLGRYLAEYRKRYAGHPVNLGVAVGRSGLVVVDADTAEQVSGFLADADAAEAAMDPAPTVTTPGKQDDAGAWVHADGGHYWFTVDVPLPEDVPGVPASGGYAVMAGDRYVLIPPSQRPEGGYTVTGEVRPLPGWLRERIADAAEGKLRWIAERADGEADADLGDSIAAWAEAVSWAEILEPHGWTPTARPDGCGCDVWTAPGPHGSPKSATTHDGGCAAGRYTLVNAPMHVWTDNPGDRLAEWIGERGTKTVTKLQAVAALDHGGDVGAAMRAHDLTREANLGFEGPVSGDRDNGQPSPLNLPAEFWDARPSLRHIRAAAHSSFNSADAVLAAVLARLSAHVPPAARVDTGVKSPLTLNMFVGLVDASGGGKTSAAQRAEAVLKVDPGDPISSDVLAPAADEGVLYEAPLGSGEGIAEVFTDTVARPKPGGKGNATVNVREQVRSNVLLFADEGEALVQVMQGRSGSTLGPLLRGAWSGGTLGQSNATKETTRKVKGGAYSLGLIVGFQQSVLAKLLTVEQFEMGLPQRFLFARATDPAARAGIADPGVLDLGELPAEPLHLCDTLKEQVKDEALRRLWGGETPPEDSQRPAMTARLAALLALLERRAEVSVDDWALAEILYTTSRAVADDAREYAREQAAEEAAQRSAARVAEAVTTEAAKDVRGATLGKLQDRIMARLAEAGGPVKWTGRDGLRGKFPGRDRVLADMARDALLDDGKVVDEGGLLRAAQR